MPKHATQGSPTKIGNTNDKHHNLESQNNLSSSVFDVHVSGRLTTEHVPLLIHSINGINTLRGRAGPVHEDTLSVAFDEAPSLA